MQLTDREILQFMAFIAFFAIGFKLIEYQTKVEMYEQHNFQQSAPSQNYFINQ